MRILVLAPRFPWPPDKGDRLTIYHYLRCLSRSHSVALATFMDDEDVPHLDKVDGFVTRSALVYKPAWDGALRSGLALAGSKPLQVAYYASELMAAKIDELVRSFNPDVLYCHTLRMAQYAQRYPQIPALLGLQISMALNYRRLVERSRNPLEKWVYGLEHRRVKSYEVELAKAFNASVLISKTDLEEMEAFNGSPLDRVRLLAHGVDDQFFHPSPQTTILPKSLVMTGNMGYPPNRQAVAFMVEQILPRIWEQEPQATLWVVGKNPGSGLKAYHDGVRIHVTGEVQDTRPYLWQSQVAVVPVQAAAGLQNKLLEALACGKPTVATPEANEGIRAAPEREVLLGQDASEFAQQVVRLLRDEVLAASLGRQGRSFIERTFTWDFFLDQMVAWMQGMVRTR